MTPVTALKNKSTQEYRLELSQFIAHHQGLAMINIELAKGTWNPWKRRKFFRLAELAKQEAAILLNEYRTIWPRKT